MKAFIVLASIFCLDCIHVEYPKINHEEIIEFIEAAKNDFLSEYHENNQLHITFEEYNSDYESYLFYVMQDFQGAHPITYLKTFNYYKNNFINLENIFSEKDYYNFYLEAKKILIPELKKEEMFIEDMFFQGIEPIKENYKNIILYDEYYYIFFEHYQIAPYGAGIRKLIVKK